MLSRFIPFDPQYPFRFRRWPWAKSGGKHAPKRRPRRALPTLEALENRIAPAWTTYVTLGTLHIECDDADDDIAVAANGTHITVSDHGGSPQAVALQASLIAIAIDAGDGDNTIGAGGLEGIGIPISIISGTGSDDIIAPGGGGGVTVDSGDGDDTVTILPGTGNGGATIQAGAGHDAVTVTDDGNADVDGGPGNDTINTGGGDDAIDAGIGDDIVSAGGGNDIVQGGPDDDIIDLGDGDDVGLGNGGDDEINGEVGDDTLLGGPDDDNISGGDDDDILDDDDDPSGGGGSENDDDDNEDGGPGNDTIGSGGGSDTVDGGGGDDVLPVLVSFLQESFAESEGAGQARITAKLNRSTDVVVTVNYVTSAITATPTIDYSDTSGTLTFQPGETQKWFYVSIANDSWDEPDETVALDLLNPVNAALTKPFKATLTIQDDDAPPSLSISDAQLYEGNLGVQYAIFVVSVSALSGSEITVQYWTTNGSATAGSDYGSTSGTLTIPAYASAGYVLVPVYGDTLYELNETYFVQLGGASNATISDGTGDGTIFNDDTSGGGGGGGGPPTLSIDDVTVTENDEGTVDAMFTVTLSYASPYEVTVNYATEDGTATAGSDYDSTSGTVTIPPGSTSRQILVRAKGDVINEYDEDFQVRLTNPSNAVLELRDKGRCVIRDNDPLPKIYFDPGEYSVSEADGIVTLTVKLDAAAGRDIVVSYQTEDGDATESQDYTPKSGDLTFSPGQTVKTITVSILEDNSDEPDETFKVELQNPIHAALGNPSVATVEIMDNDLPLVGVVATDDEAAEEGPDPGVFTITRVSEDLKDPLAVYFQLSGTATYLADYTLQPNLTGWINIPANEESVTLTVVPVDDQAAEWDEFVLLTILPDAGYNLVSDPQDWIVIRDNDRSAGGGGGGGGIPPPGGPGGPVGRPVTSKNNDQPSTGEDKSRVTRGPITTDRQEGQVEANAGAQPQGIQIYCACYWWWYGDNGTAPKPRSQTNENPHPIVGVDFTLSDNEAVPNLLEAQLTFAGLTFAPVFYSTTGLQPGETVRFVLQADATTLATGHYEYTVKVTGHFDNGIAEVPITGSTEVFNRIQSEFGNRWWIPELARLTPAPGGMALIRGDGTAGWFVEDGQGGYITPDGSSTRLVRNANGSFTLWGMNGSHAEFNANGLLMARIDPNGNATTYTYVDADGDGQADELSTWTDAFGRTSAYAYTNGLLTSITETTGEVTDYTYDANRRLIAVTEPDPDGAGPLPRPVTHFTYNEIGLLSGIENATGEDTSVEYSFARRFESATNADGTQWESGPLQVVGLVNTSTGVGTQENPAPITRPQDVKSIYRDELGNVWSYRLDTYGYVTEETDPLGNITAYERNADGLLTKLTRPDPDGGGPLLAPVTLFAYDDRFNLTSMTLPGGATRSWVYEPIFNDVTSHTNELGRVTTFSYDANGNKLTESNPLGRTTSWTYDAGGQVLSVTEPDPDGAGPLSAPVTSYTYDSYGHVLTVTNADGSVRSYAYDEYGNRIGETNELGKTTTYVYGPQHRLLGVTSPASGTTTYTYDLLGRQRIATDALGNATEYAYDSMGRVVSVTLPDPDGAGAQPRPVLTYAYNAAGWLTGETDPLGRTMNYQYDAAGRLVQVVAPDPDGAGPLGRPTVQYAYDNLGRKTSETDPLGRITQFDYDIRDRLVTIINALGGTTRYAYDAAGQMISITDALGRVTSFGYDLAGRLTSTTDAANKTTTTGYDNLGRITSITDPLNRVTQFTYDVTGRLTSTRDALNGEWSTNYNAAGWVMSETNALGRVTSYTYDDAGHVLTITEPDPDAGGPLAAPVTSFAYDLLGQMTFVTDALNHTTQYVYDGLGRQTRVIDAPNHTWDTVYDLAGNVVKVIDALGRDTEFFYDGLNRLVQVQDALDHSTFTEYDAAGNVTKVTDALGRSTRWVYDALDREVEQIDALNHSSHMAYDAVGNVTSVTNVLGDTTQFGYDVLNRLVSVVDALEGETTTTYDAVGNVLSATDPLNRTTQWVYDALNRPIETVDALNHTWYTVYDLAGNVVKVIDALGRDTEFFYDGLDRLIQEKDALDQSTFTEYDAASNVTKITDALGRSTQWAYDALNREIQQIDALNHSSYTAYDAVGNVTSVTNVLGDATQFSYDVLDRLVSVVDALDGETTTTYDAVGNVLTVTDPLNRTTQWVYDALNRPIESIDALGHSAYAGYDAVGNVTSGTDVLGHTTQFTYDRLARLVSVIDALNGVTSTSYDAVGNVITFTNALGRTTQYAYDALYRNTHVTDPLGRVTVTEFDAVGNVTGVRDPMNRLTQFEYDALDRLVSTIDPLNQETLTEYDALGNVTKVTDPLGHFTRYEYDALGRQTKIIDALGGETLMTYDALGQLLSLRDPALNVTSYVYDVLGRITVETDPLGLPRLFGYNAVGDLTHLVDRNGRVRQFTYDALGRETAEKWLDGLGNIVRTISFAYDNAGQLLSGSDPDSAYAFGYDLLGRATTISNAGTPGVPTVVLTQSFDSVSRRTSVAATISGQADFSTNYEYDDADRMTRITQTGPGVGTKRVDFTYNVAGQYDIITRYADVAGTDGVAVTTHLYDGDGRLTELKHRRPTSEGGATLALYTWTFDSAGRITQQTTPDGSTTYSYDNTNQLVGADHSYQTDESYSYDANGNRTNPGYVTGVGNRLLEDASYTYAYDAEGNRIRRTNKATGQIEEYAWDYRNRLASVTEKTSAGMVVESVSFTYDLFDRRIAKSVDLDGPGPLVASQERFVYDGDQVALAFDGTGSLTNRYLWGPDVDQLLADEQVHVGGVNDLFWSLADHLGSVRDLITSDALLVKHVVYDSFGRVTSDSNPAIKTAYGYTGREFEAAIGLQYNRARWYDAAVGRWLSVDPIGFAAGDANLYRYVDNGPLVATDPSGLQSGLRPHPRMKEDTLDGKSPDGYFRPANNLGEKHWYSRKPKQSDTLIAVMEDAQGNYHYMGTLTEHDYWDWQDKLEALKFGTRVEAFAGLLGDGMQIAAGALWIYGTGGVGAIFGGGYLMFRGMDGAVADLGTLITGENQKSGCMIGLEKAFQAAGQDPQTAEKNATIAEFGLRVADLLLSLKAASKAGPGRTFSVRAPVPAMSVSPGGAAAMTWRMEVVASISMSKAAVAAGGGGCGRILLLKAQSENGFGKKQGPTKPDPNWKNTNTWDTGANAKKLRQNMGSALKPGEDAHHIVQGTHPRADAARKILDKYQIGINERANGIGLKPSGPKPAHHGHGLHSHAGIDEVTRRLEAAVKGVKDWGKARRRLLDALDDIRTQIGNGDFP